MDTPTHVVLLNSVCEDADLGPLKSFREEHIDPEADLHIIPKGEVRGVEFLEPAK